MVYCTYS